MAQRAMKPHKNKPGQVEQVSSPGKIYHSRASKPSAISAVGTQTPAVDQATTNTNIAALQAKLDALIAALKK